MSVTKGLPLVDMVMSIAESYPGKLSRNMAKGTNVQPEKTGSDAEFLGGSADARAYRRRSVLWPAKVLVGRHEFSCQIWNMSLAGARVRLDMPIKEGTAVQLVMAGRGEIPAVVRWYRDNAAGLAFVIEPEEVRMLFLDRAQMLGFETDTGAAPL